MQSSYKIARFVRTSFKDVRTFVPHVAASGATLLALTGDEMVMGPMSHITPLDVQLRYKDTAVSAATAIRFFARASKWFEKTAPDEAPYSEKALTDKLDPFLMEEWSGHMDTAIEYVSDILDMVGYEESSKIARMLVMGFPSHPYVIHAERARGLGLNAKDASDYGETWEVMRYWLGKYALSQEPLHCIRYVCPRAKDSESPEEEQGGCETPTGSVEKEEA